MEWHPEFRVGRTRLQVSFTGGHLCGGAITPASYETADPVVQKVIETSMAFRNGRIRAVCGYGATQSIDPPAEDVVMHDAVPISSVMEATASKAGSTCTVMEFEDIDEAADFLQDRKGIPIDRVLTREQCMAEASQLGIDMKIKK